MKLYFHFLTELQTQIPENKAVQNEMISSNRSAELRKVDDDVAKVREEIEADRERRRYLENNVSGSLFTSTDGRTSSELES